MGWSSSDMCNKSGKHTGLLGFFKLGKGLGGTAVFTETGDKGAAGIEDGLLTTNLLVKAGSVLARSALGAVIHILNIDL